MEEPELSHSGLQPLILAPVQHSCSIRQRYLARLGYLPLCFRKDNDTLLLPYEDPTLTPKRLSSDMLKAGSTTASVFNLCSATLGAGALSLPYAVSKAGVLASIVLLFIAAFLTVYSIQLLIESRYLSRLSSYEDLTMLCFGTWATYIVEINIALFCFGTCVAYIIAMSDCLLPFLELVTVLPSILRNRAALIIVVSIGILLPLSLVDKMSSLRFTSLLAIVTISYLVFAICGISLHNAGSWPSDITWTASSPKDIALAVPIILFAFTAQVNVFSIYTELRRPSIRRMNKVSGWSTMISLVLYGLIGIFGYLQNTVSTDPDILNNYHLSNPVIAIAQVCVGVTVILAFPLNVFPCRFTLEMMFFSSQGSRIPFICLTVGIVVLSALLAILLPGIDVVFSLLGSTTSAVVCFILPAAFSLKLKPHDRWSASWVAEWAFLVAGVVVGIVSTCISILHILQS